MHLTSSRFLVIALALLLAGCDVASLKGSTATPTAAPFQPSETPTASPTPTKTPTAVPSITPTPTWVTQGPDRVQVPILMYHHVEVDPIDSPYRVPVARFEEEIRLLRNWEYTSISTSMLTEAITTGALLPPRPIIITFDDANEDNYSVAFPIMQKYGFTGVLYLPYAYIGAPGYLTVDQIKEMVAAGWEVGSHSLTHTSEAVMSQAQLRAEIVDSKEKLESLLGTPVLTFAYPFGDVTSAAVDYVQFAGYIAAMDAKGFTADQGRRSLFALQREEIRGSEDAKTFIRFLPWLGDSSFLPTDTPTPTPRPTRTPVPTYTQYPTRTPRLSPTP